MSYQIMKNDYENGRVHFRSVSGNVLYSVSKLPSNCGVAVVYSPIWNIAPGKKEELYKSFFDHLKNAKDIRALSRCKMIMSDEVNGPIDMFCKFFEEEWYEGLRTYNKKSGNHIVVFECDRNPTSVSDGD